MSLHYVVKREETEKAVRFVAEGSEWSCNVRGEVTLSPEFPKKKFEGPETRYIGWSCTTREWTIEDARTFFQAGLRLLDALEFEVKYQKSKAEYDSQA